MKAEAANLEEIVGDLLAVGRECEWVEFKLNNSQPAEIGEYLSALSNGACLSGQPYGWQVFGVNDKTLKVEGTTFDPFREKIGNQELESWIAVQLDPPVDFKFIAGKYQGKSMVLIQVEATRHTPVKFKGTAYIRIGSYKKKLVDHPERERKIWHKVNDAPFEKEIAQSMVDSDHVLSLIDYEAFFRMMQLPSTETSEATLERLALEKIIHKVGSSWDITCLGAILFARDLRQFPSIERKAVRVISYSGNSRLQTEWEQEYRQGYACGFEALIQHVHERLPGNEVIEKAIRKQVKLFPIIALRELLANAMIHQAFEIKGAGPMVEIFNNRIEVSNPGKPLINPVRFIDHNPESRNESLASLMRRLGVCEERGSGIDKVIFQCEIFQLPPPDFVAGDNFTRVTLYAPKPFSSMDRLEKVRACYQHCCLKYVSGESMTNQTLRARFGISEKNYAIASRIIADAKTEGVVKDYDPGNKSRTYAKYVPFWA